MYEFKKYLFAAYGGFGDKRVKDITKDYPFKIDGQGNDDSHEHFCGIFVRVTDGKKFELHLTNNAPINSKIKNMIKQKNGEVQQGDTSSIKVNLTVKDSGFIKMLADEVKNMVGPGKTYKNRNWKWLCPRTATSLNRFAKILKEYEKKETVRKEFF